MYGDLPPLALPAKFTSSGACPLVGEALALAARPGVAVTYTVTEAVAVMEALSVTVRIAVKSPDVE